MNSDNGHNPERYRSYLRAIARAGLSREVQGKVDPSDIVQQTLLLAHRAESDFRGTIESERIAWLKKILSNVIARTLRDLRRDRRDIRREQSLEDDLLESWMKLENSLAITVDAPPDAIARQETLLKLCDAVEQLPEAQRMAVELHHFAGLTISQVAEELDRSPTAVAGLLKRGLRTLRSSMGTERSA
ncbi:MAG: sigma-70 family RNA polymerase sigma factor [Planctomycetaceae bacterium]